MKTRFLIESLILLLSMSSPSIAQNAKKHSLPDKTYDMAAGNISGDKVRGPRRIVIKNLNTLRYNYTLSRAVSYTAVGDLWSKLLSVNAAGAETAPEQQPKGLVAPGKQQPAPCGEAQNAVDQADAVIADIKQRSAAISDIKSQVDANRKNLDDLLHAVQVAVGHVTEGGQQLTEALRRNSTVPDGIVSDISLLLSQNPKSLFLVGVDAAWVDETDVKKLQADTEKSKKLVDTQKSTFAKFITDQSAAIASADEALARVSEVLKANKPECVQIVNAKRKELTASKEDLTRASSLLDWESSELDKIQAAIPDLLEGSTKQSSFIQAREALREWKGRMDSLLTRWNDYRNALTHNQDLELHTDPFSMVTYGDCEFAFPQWSP